ncbi:2-nitropropane dioxygenase [Panaeolus papilionaceus]|nr:2-nitropropane dioxygenase [Panaeolus papilionaceus]
MAGASGGALAAQVSLAGGFGFIGAGYGPLEVLQNDIKIAREVLQLSEASTLPIGVGFLVWLLEKAPIAEAEKAIDTVLEARVKAVWLAFGADIGRWIKYIRRHDRHGVKIFVQLSTPEQLQLALDVWHVDAIIVQGNEAGGHGIGSSLPLLTLFPLLKALVPESRGIPILAAGGLSTGAQIASLLALGASGVVIGTRFLLSNESLYMESQKNALIAADSSMSTRSMAFDYARNTLGWPAGVDGRGLRNDTVKDFENGVDIDTLREKTSLATKAGDANRMVIWAGASVGLVNKVLPARDILTELHEECLQHLKQAARCIEL